MAIDFFSLRVAQAFASLSVSLGGLDDSVFTAGVGENAHQVRRNVVERLRWAGFALDEEANSRNDCRIEAPGSRVPILVVPTDEERMIGQHTLRPCCAGHRIASRSRPGLRTGPSSEKDDEFRPLIDRDGPGGDAPDLRQRHDPGLSRRLAQHPAQAQSRIKEFLQRLRSGNLPAGIAKSNGRIEATQIDVAAKYAGRLSQVLVNEGDDVTAGRVVAKISSPEYEAQLRGAQSQVLKAKQGLAEANALIVQRKSEITLTQAELERGQQLVDKGYLTRQTFDQRVAKADTAKAALVAAEAQREQAAFAIKSAEAEVDRIEAVLVDMTLVAPRSGRVQHQLARAGEVVGAGSRILTLLDLSDVYMTIYLPAAQAGLLALGDEARITVDPLPNYVIPANVSFVAADAQFTPKSVETADEREKLMFRVKLQIDPRSEEIPPPGQDRRARHGLRAHQRLDPVARRPQREAPLMSDGYIARVENVLAPIRQDGRAR